MDPAPPSAPELPLGVEPDSPHETVRITLLWTGDPRELDLALLELRENACTFLDNRVHPSDDHRRATQAARLARQIVNGALGEDDDEDEPHEHLGVVRWERGGAAR